MYNQFRPPLFPNNYGNIGNGANFNQQYGMKPGMYQQQFGGMPPNAGYGNQNIDGYALHETSSQGGAVSPSNNNTMIDDGSIRNSSRRINQVQHHVQQVPVYRTIQVQERYVEIPQIHIVKEYVPKIEIVERVREVPKIEYQIVEKIVDVPQVQYVDKYVDKIEIRDVIKHVPKIEIVEVVREVFKVEYQIVERIVEVPQIQYIDKVVEVTQIKEVIKHVPKIEVIEVPVRKEVRVPKIEIRQVEEVKEVIVPEIIEVPIEKEIRVNVNVPRIQRVERPVPGPLNIVDVEVEVKVPKPVQVPHYIDVPVPREVVKEIPVPRQVIRYRDVEVPVEVEHIVVERVERRVPVPRTVYKHVEEIRRIEVPYEVTIPQEVEEIVEVINQIQPVIEPIVHTRYEKLPPIREQGKAVYMNGPSSKSQSPVQTIPFQSNQARSPQQTLNVSQPSESKSPMSQASPIQASPQQSFVPTCPPGRLLPPIAPGTNTFGPPNPYQRSSPSSQPAAPKMSFGTLATPLMVPSHPFQQLAFSNSQLSTPLAATAINLPPAEQPAEEQRIQSEEKAIEKVEEADSPKKAEQADAPKETEEHTAEAKEQKEKSFFHESIEYPKETELSREETGEIAPIFYDDNSDDSNLADKTIAGEDAPNEPLVSWEPLSR